MTPGKRLDQLEPIMADVIQKVDRLIEGQGQLVEIATRADQNANTIAKGLATLTLTTQKQFEQVNAKLLQIDTRFEQVDARFDRLEANQNEMRQDINTLKQDVNLMKQDVSGLKQDVNSLKQDVATLKQDVSSLKAGQELIIQILREKLP